MKARISYKIFPAIVGAVRNMFRNPSGQSGRKFVAWGLIILGVLLSANVVFEYYSGGYEKILGYAWVLAVALVAVGLRTLKKKETRINAFDTSDIFIGLGAVILLLPFYVGYIYNFPVQVSTDEQAIMSFIQELTTNKPSDLFGLSNYFQYPALVFIFLGWIGELLGGFGLYHLRLTHAITGLAVIFGTYFLFRLLLTTTDDQRVGSQKLYAFVGAVLVGFSHSFLIISRMAMYNTTSLLVEIPAFILLYIGITRKDIFYTFLGGVISGLSVYNYLPGRSTLPIWLLFLFALLLFYRKRFTPPQVSKHALLAILGFLMIAAPVFVSSFTSTRTEFVDVRTKSIVFPEGRLAQRDWVFASTIGEGIKINLIQGLGALNNKVYDHNYVYVNRGHGFVDPLTGILLWLGIGVTMIRRDRSLADIFILICFLSLWLALSLLFTKNPHYNRLIILLPFVVYFVVNACMWLGRSLQTLLSKVYPNLAKMNLAHVFSLSLVVIIIGLNLNIAGDFIRQGIVNGDVMGGTARYVDSKENFVSYNFYLVADKQSNQYYSRSDPWRWREWFGYFKSPSQDALVIEPSDLANTSLDQPFTIFMSQNLWREKREELQNNYPELSVHNITPSGSHIAIEVL